MVQEDLGKIEFTQVGKFGARGLSTGVGMSQSGGAS